MPLISTKLKAKDCRRLVERFTARVKTWTDKFLSYAGKTQLIKSELFSIQVNWSSMFTLPKKIIIIKSIEAILHAVLWKGVDLESAGAKVAWASICCQKHEGGLGFKDLYSWNRAAIIKHVNMETPGDCTGLEEAP
ncbi:hypothetical protein Acr_20g0002370 [Actinidia rufa]|uniref:Uncharacterized protein n=1 Tax=Actinidia rufa TaxID=165716 RepID=A0A7J0GCB7_9ERIC|nr:hypothetical protein Acr_20g0002370 [Actinidia rufa]